MKYCCLSGGFGVGIALLLRAAGAEDDSLLASAFMNAALWMVLVYPWRVARDRMFPELGAVLAARFMRILLIALLLVMIWHLPSVLKVLFGGPGDKSPAWFGWFWWIRAWVHTIAGAAVLFLAIRDQGLIFFDLRISNTYRHKGRVLR